MRFVATVRVSIRTIATDFSGSIRRSQRASGISSVRRIRANSGGLTVIPPVKYPYSYLIVSLFGHKVINKAPIQSFPKSHLKFEAAPLSRLISWLVRHKRDRK